MRLLAIETSCDETAVTVLDGYGPASAVSYAVLGNALYSQAEKHAAYGGVYPSLAKREHATNLVPMLSAALREAGLEHANPCELSSDQMAWLSSLLVREPDLAYMLLHYLQQVERPALDAIAVTHGPGLEPALWVGIQCARALAYVWNLPIIPVNHLEGHLVASSVSPHATLAGHYTLCEVRFPALGLILSGGHTEFILMKAWGTYEVIGATRDDSIGEAYDKVARLLGLPYPGGPGISRLAAWSRQVSPTGDAPTALIGPLPRPMIDMDNLDFSFSGLKTAVLYRTRTMELTDETRAHVAAAFEEAATDVVVAKTARALEHVPVATFILGGGVSANAYLRMRLATLVEQHGPDLHCHVPADGLSTDNAVMIGMAGYLAHLREEPEYSAADTLRANGSLSIATTTPTP